MSLPTPAVIEFINAPVNAWLARLESTLARHCRRHGLSVQFERSQVEGVPAQLRLGGEDIALAGLAKYPQAEMAELLRLRIARSAGLSTILFVCTGNAIRSQVAEALVNHFHQDRWAAFSAGTMPMAVTTDTVEVMEEIGIHLKGRFAKSVDLFRECRFDRVVILCSDAGTRCPVFPYSGPVDALHFDDPMAHDALSGAIHFGFKGQIRTLRKRMQTALQAYLEQAA